MINRSTHRGRVTAAALAILLWFTGWQSPDSATAEQPSRALQRLVQAIGQSDDVGVRVTLMEGIRKGLEGRRDVKPPEGWKELSEKLAGADDPRVRDLAWSLSQSFGDVSAIERALRIVRDESMSMADRRDALDALLRQQNREASNMLSELIDDEAWTITAIRGYAEVKNDEAPAVLLKRYAGFDQPERRATIETLASRKSYAEALIAALRDGTIDPNEVPRPVARGLRDLLGESVADVLVNTESPTTDHGTIANRDELLAKYKKMCNESALEAADVERGHAVFRKTCAACHLLYGEGGTVGPDLTGSNRGDLDYLLLNSIDPSADVADAYKTTTVLTVDGRVINGVLAEEDAHRIVLKTPEQPRIVVAKRDIEQRRTSPKSMMPDGQLDQMSEQEVVDLVKFLRVKKPLRNRLPKKKHRISDAPFLTPQKAVDRMAVPEGFEVSVFAAEPDIAEPIAFCFDDRGRLWVAENFNYQTRREHSDAPVSRIQILEDSDGDGTFDHKKTFVDNLTFTSGIACGFGGVFVGSPPNLTFIPDADRDDRPDGPPQVLLDGWGMNDRHETLNSFIWGPDGWLYGCHGVFTHSLVGKPGADESQRQFIDAGIWRYHPTRDKFEIFARGLSNPWGFDFDDHGQGFATCCVIPHLFHVVQGGVYHKQSRPHVNPHIYDDIKTIRDHEHLSAHGGARFYLADAFPDKYRGRLFMCNIHEHAVLTDVMEPTGSTFIGRHGDDFLPTNDLAWVGFSVEIGPEGGVYLLDWHDQDICGNAVKFPNSGRVYRVMPKGAKHRPPPDLNALSDLELVRLQTHANDWYVRQARTLLQFRSTADDWNGGQVHAELRSMFRDADSGPGRLRALWASYVTGGLESSDIVDLLGHDDPHVRAWSIQFLCDQSHINAFQPPQPGIPAAQHSEPSSDGDFELPATVLDQFTVLAAEDPSPVVRLYLTSAAQRIPFAQRWPLLEALASHDEDISDNNLPRMQWFALEPMVTHHPERSLTLAIRGRQPMLRESVARKLVTGDAPPPVLNQNQKRAKWNKTLSRNAPGFRVGNVGEGGVVGHSSFKNRTAVRTHPIDAKTPCVLRSGPIDIPDDRPTHLHLTVSHHPHGDWRLRVLANQTVLIDETVGPETVGDDQWMRRRVDLSAYAGQRITLAIENRASGWHNEWAYWHQVKVE